MVNILIVDDDKNIRKLLKVVLERQGYIVHLASDGLEALKVLDQVKINLVVVDIMMPNMDGFELVAAIKDYNKNLPVLMVTARGSYNDKLCGFNLGVDDYMVKPIDINELTLRVNAILRRSKIANENRVTIGSTVLDSESYTVTTNNETVTLPQKEFLLLFKLLSYPDRVFTRFEIMDEIWGYESDSDEKTINVHISKLRSRYDNNPDFSIETVRGIGYKAVLK